uniref:Cytochrome P450 n=1 Tax=Leersia perrieri TaxID=77586 RepID=A0A0D9XFY1_9ORYZ
MSSSYVALAAALLVAVVVFAAIKSHGKGKLPPSPPSLPFIGHLHLIGDLPHRSLDALHRRYGGGGGGLMSLRLGGAGVLAVQLRELLYAYANGVITRVAAGGGGATAERFRRMVVDTSELLAGFQWVDRLPAAAAWAARMVTGLDKKLDDMAEDSDRFLSEIMAAHDEEKEEGEEEDFVDVLLRLRREGAAAGGVGVELAEDDIKGIIKDIMGAATDTSFVTLEWIMTELIRNKRAMTKLQNKIRQVTGCKPTVTEDDLTKMDCLDAVMKETL